MLNLLKILRNLKKSLGLHVCACAHVSERKCHCNCAANIQNLLGNSFTYYLKQMIANRSAITTAVIKKIQINVTPALEELLCLDWLFLCLKILQEKF